MLIISTLIHHLGPAGHHDTASREATVNQRFMFIFCIDIPVPVYYFFSVVFIIFVLNH